jgi:hypothetical protein
MDSVMNHLNDNFYIWLGILTLSLVFLLYIWFFRTPISEPFVGVQANTTRTNPSPNPKHEQKYPPHTIE